MTPHEIKSLRKKLRLTQQAFADAVNVSFASVNRWENGVSKPGKLAIDRMENLDRQGAGGVLFRLRGKTYRLTKEEVEDRLESIEPRPSEKYSVMIGETLFPPKQVLSEALGLPVLAFTTIDAQRILQKIGFEVIENHTEAPAPAGNAKVRDGAMRAGTIIAGPIRDTKGRDWMVVVWNDDDDGNPELHLATDLWRPYQ